MLRPLIGLSDAAMLRSAAFAHALDVLVVLSEHGFLMGVPLAGHLGQVDVALELLLGALHAGLAPLDICLDHADVTASAGLLNTVLDLLPGQELSLLNDGLGALLKSLAERAELFGCLLLIRMAILISYIVLHPVDVEGAGLLTVDR